MYSNSTTSSEMSNIVTPIHKNEKRFTGVQVSHDPTKKLSCWVLETLSTDSSIKLQIGNFDCTSTHDDDNDDHDHHHQQLRNSIAQKFLNSLKKNEALQNTHPPKQSKFADLLNLSLSLSLSHRDVSTQVINNTPKFNSLVSTVNFHEHPLDL
jgi:hypothetical protein